MTAQTAVDYQLTAREEESMRSDLIILANERLVMRSVVPVLKVDPGTQSWRYKTIDEVGTARVMRKGDEYYGVDIDKNESAVTINKIGASFKIFREDLLSSRKTGNPLDTLLARQAGYLVQNKEDDFILNGDSDLGVSGLYDLVGATQAAAAVWSGATPEAQFQDVLNALANFQAKFGDRDKVLLLTPQNFLEAAKRGATTGFSALNYLSDFGIRVVVTEQLATDTGLLMATGRDIAEWVVAEDLVVESLPMASNESLPWICRIRGGLVVYQAGALVSVTGL